MSSMNPKILAIIAVIVIPSSIGPDCKAGQACPMYMRLVTPGDYPLAVENSSGTSNAISFTVIGK
jgi:hypothetical protein